MVRGWEGGWVTGSWGGAWVGKKGKGKSWVISFFVCDGARKRDRKRGRERGSGGRKLKRRGGINQKKQRSRKTKWTKGKE